MKKLFTLVAAALCALTASAKQTLESTWSPWDPKTATVDGSKISFSAAWAGAGYWLAGDKALDLSDYDYIVVKLAKCTNTANFAVEYTNDGSNAFTDDNKVASNASAPAGAAIVGIPLNMDYKTNVIQMWVQAPAADMEVEITEVYAATEEEFLADKEGNKQQTSDIALTGWGVWGNEVVSNTDEGYLKIEYPKEWGGAKLWFGGFDASEFDYLVAEIEPTDVITQLFVQYTNTPAEVTVDPEKPNDAKNQTAQAKPGETEISIPLYASAKNAIDQIAIQNGAPGTIIVKKIYWKASSSSSDPTGINSVNAAQKAENNVRYNLLGVKNGNGIYIMNGKKYMK